MSVALQAAADDPTTAFSAPAERPIDLVHLTRMTLGERSLEREILQLFVRQAENLVARMRAAEPRSAAELAHTLKGSARGVGAWRAARAAEAAELAASSGEALFGGAVRELETAVNEASRYIHDLLRPN